MLVRVRVVRLRLRVVLQARVVRRVRRVVQRGRGAVPRRPVAARAHAAHAADPAHVHPADAAHSADPSRRGAHRCLLPVRRRLLPRRLLLNLVEKTLRFSNHHSTVIYPNLPLYWTLHVKFKNLIYIFYFNHEQKKNKDS